MEEFLSSEDGIVLSNKPSIRPHQLRSNPAQFVKRAQRRLVQHAQYPDNVNELATAITNYLEASDVHLRGALSPVHMHQDCENALSQVQESLIRILLQIEDLQPRLIDWLLEKVALLSHEDEEQPHETSSASCSSQHSVLSKVNFSQLILVQLQFLGNVVEPEALADKLLEVLDAASTEVQRDIILNLSDIADERYHGKFAMPLRDLMRERDLSNCILDAFSSLSIPNDVMTEVQHSILKTLETTDLRDVPCIVKFIMDAIIPGEEVVVIRELREKLELAPSQATLGFLLHGKAREKTSKKKSKSKNNLSDVDTMFLHVIKMFVSSNRALADAWFRVIEEVKSAKDHKTIDFLVMLLLHSLPNKKKPVESLFKNKVRAGHLSEDLAKRTLKAHAVALSSPIFEDLIELLDILCHSMEPILANFAHVLLTEAFCHFNEACQYDLMSDFVRKITISEAGRSRQIALKTLDAIVHSYEGSLSKHVIFLTPILDHLDVLDLVEVRQVMNTLSYLAYARPTEASTLPDNIQIVVKKQVSSNNCRLKRMGVTGAVMTVKNMSCPNNDGNTTMNSTLNTTSTGAASHAEKSQLHGARNLLELVRNATKHVSEAGGLFLDELANVIDEHQMHKALQGYIRVRMTNYFQDEFVADVENPDTGTKLLPSGADFMNMELAYEIQDEEGPSAIVLNLCPLVIKSIVNEGNDAFAQDTLASRMIPHFRLLKSSILANHESELSEIDALVSCPIWMPHREGVMDKIESLDKDEKNVICASLFYCVNWFRELLNTFARHSKPGDDRKKVLIRLKHILQVEADIRLCLKANPSFCPPAMLHLVDTSSWTPPNIQAKKGRDATKGKGKGKVRKRKHEETLINLNTQGNSQTERTQLTLPTTPNDQDTGILHMNDSTTDTSIDLSHYAPFFRELDLDVFHIFSYDEVNIGSEPPAQEELKDPKLRPADLLFVLNDFKAKLDHALLSSKPKKSGFPGKGTHLKDAVFLNLDQKTPADVAQFARGQLDYLLAHLEQIETYFSNIIDMNEGFDNCASLFSDVTPVLANCFERILQIVKCLVAWNGFLADESRPLLKEVLCAIGSRCSPQLTGQDNLDDLCCHALKYVSKLSKKVALVGIADAQLRLMEQLVVYIDEERAEAARNTIAKVAEDYLKRDWKNVRGLPEKGSAFNSHLEELLRAYLTYVDEPAKVISNYVRNEMPKVLVKQATELSSYPTFNKATFALHFKLFLEHLVLDTRTRLTYRERADQGCDELMTAWSERVVTLFGLVMVLKVSSQRPLIIAVLKHARHFLDHYLKHCMPIIDKKFASARDKCISLLKDMQQNTRFLQHVCSHSKILKDVSLSSNVPLLKRSLETFVFRVKAMLAINNAASVFWMGNLKNRKLDGEEIFSQNSNSTGTDDDEDSDSNPTENNEGDSSEESEISEDHVPQPGDDAGDDNADESVAY